MCLYSMLLKKYNKTKVIHRKFFESRTTIVLILAHLPPDNYRVAIQYQRMNN